MNIQRFTAATSREALAKARMAFGEGTLILSNRPTEHGVEVVATAEDSLAQLDDVPAAPVRPASASTPRRDTAAAPSRDSLRATDDDTAQLAMSTLSFQDYVRERMLRKRNDSTQTPAQERATTFGAASAAPTTPAAAAPIEAPSLPRPTPVRTTAAAGSALPQSIFDELHAMKALMEDRFNTLTWLGQARQNPIQSNLMLKLIRAGYSPTLSRTILERMPEDMDANASARWVLDVLERNLRTDAGRPALHEEGGIFALTGATGVGKTTTAAKLAGLCASTYGAHSVGLITLDTYRIGAHEQLRAYGKMLGVVAHLAHDRAALQDLLGLLSNKKLVLVDTTGVAPRDPRKQELSELFDLPGVKRLLVLNSSAHGDTLDDVIGAFKQTSAQQVIFSKIDEAVKLGPVIDAAIRHQLVVRGVTTGQRVPEDWEAALASRLVRQSLSGAASSAFDPNVGDLGFFFNQSGGQRLVQGHLDA